MRSWKETLARLHYRSVGRFVNNRSGRVLCYHSVKAEDAWSFSAHLDFLAQQYEVLPLSQFLRRMVHLNNNSGRPVLAITFDDGYRDNYEIVFPLLRGAGLSAAFFVVSGIRSRTAAERDASPEPVAGGWSPRLFMTWEELREMAQADMEVHLHGHSHQNTASLSTDELTADVEANRNAVVSEVGATPLAYAIPFGRPKDCHPALPSILENSGVKYAMLATHGRNDSSVPAYALHRDAVDASCSVDYLRAVLHGCFDWLR
jgi:peptidoglycan/xylan/chitin deacetylase (PgdA/CDA1 family)